MSFGIKVGIRDEKSIMIYLFILAIVVTLYMTYVLLKPEKF
ncbi:MAG: potassium-transporting ATPase subunit F [Flavobacteriales bacterium]|nr:potassium-transporting ATPase subunit F [Flavobacteriales bacterium]